MRDRIALRLTYGTLVLLLGGIADLAVPIYAIRNAPVVLAQSNVEKQLAFDAASVKPSTPTPIAVPDTGITTSSRGPGGRRSGGPGTQDPGRILYPHTALKDLITEAYEVAPFQVLGPDWLAEERFDIDATMPAQTGKHDFHVMLQNLVVERFKMTMHHDTREISGYALVVAKNGSKLKQSTGGPQSYDTPEKRAEVIDRYGFPVVSPNAIAGQPSITFWKANGFRLYAQHQTMRELALALQNRLGLPVADQTELRSNYDFSLTFHSDGSGARPPELEDPPYLPGALQEQLGLKLESRKVPTQVVMIDHIEKTPKGN